MAVSAAPMGVNMNAKPARAAPAIASPNDLIPAIAPDKAPDNVVPDNAAPKVDNLVTSPAPNPDNAVFKAVALYLCAGYIEQRADDPSAGIGYAAQSGCAAAAHEVHEYRTREYICL